MRFFYPQLRLCWLSLALVLVLGLAACQKPQEKFINTDLTGLKIADHIKLSDQHGQVHDLADFKGRVVVVFFGYTQCPDVCPTTMVEMAKLMQALGERAAKVQVVFITLDPERDTQALLATYMPNFDARFLALRGDAASTEQVAKSFKVFYEKVPGKTADNYTLNHTAASYVIDTEGQLRLYLPYQQKTDMIVHDLNILLK